MQQEQAVSRRTDSKNLLGLRNVTEPITLFMLMKRRYLLKQVRRTD